MAKLKIVWTETATIVFQQILTFYNVRNGNTQYSRSIYTMEGSDLLYFAGFQYSTSQSVIGTIDIDGNVEITESTPNPITNIIDKLRLHTTKKKLISRKI